MPSTLALFGFFLLLGSVPLAIKSTKRLRAYRESRKWPTFTATMTKSFLREGSDGDGTSYLPEFAYRYSVGGTEYTSDLHTEGLAFPATEEDAREMVRRFSAGSTVQVAVKPTDPKHAILDTGAPKTWGAVQSASIVAFLAGAVIIFFEIGLAP